MRCLLLAGTILASISVPCAAAVVENGNFSDNQGNGELGFNTEAAHWTAPNYPIGYDFLWNGDTASTIGAPGFFNTVTLYGATAAPGGGATVGSVADFHEGPVAQVVNLMPNKPVKITFSWGGAQQKGFSGSDEVGWGVSLGSQTDHTSLVTVPNHGFSGWQSETFTFMPTSSSEKLTFLASGTGHDMEVFSLLSGVSASQTSVIPEPSTWAMLVMGLIGLTWAGMSKRKHPPSLRLG